MDAMGASTKNLDSDRELRRLLRAAITRSGSSKELAEELTQRLGLAISQGKLDEWCSAARSRLRFPLAFAPDFGELTGSSYELAKFVLGPRFSSLLVEKGELRELLRTLRAQRNGGRRRKKGRGKR